MKFISWTLFSAAALLAVPQPVWAVTQAVNSGIRNMPLTNTSGIIERGGTITAINPKKETIAVDGIIYPLATSIRIYAADDLETSRHNLQKSVRIRFSTVKDMSSGREKIIEIWIINPSSRPPRK